ncbi:MAG: ORF6N domain-containing protein [Ruminococcus sp.]|nr:ORF6N domain-containing protein [Ruminococcus sp.]
MNDFKITSIEQEGQRVLTTAQLAEAYGTDSKTISYNFNHNKSCYIEGKHFYCLKGEELKAIREIHELPKNINTLYLWTEKGALLHAKSLNTDKA